MKTSLTILTFFLLASLYSCINSEPTPVMSEKKININHNFIVNISKDDLIKKAKNAYPHLNTNIFNLSDTSFYLSFYCEKYFANISSAVAIREINPKTIILHVDSINNIFVTSGNILFSTSQKNLDKLLLLDQKSLIALFDEYFIQAVNAKNYKYDIFIDSKVVVDSVYRK
jgi:hypothetical protein